MLYEKRREYDKILSCYWRDAYRKHQAFEYIQHIMTEMHFTQEEKVKVKDEAMAHLQVSGISSYLIILEVRSYCYESTKEHFITLGWLKVIDQD